MRHQREPTAGVNFGKDESDEAQSRGPDSDGVVAKGPIALGHRRLSIIDLSARGAQPMVDSVLGLTLVFNGCIYNYQDLRTQLQAAGYRFFSTADSEVVIKGFHHWGTRCVEKFKGVSSNFSKSAR